MIFAKIGDWSGLVDSVEYDVSSKFYHLNVSFFITPKPSEMPLPKAGTSTHYPVSIRQDLDDLFDAPVKGEIVSVYLQSKLIVIKVRWKKNFWLIHQHLAKIYPSGSY